MSTLVDRLADPARRRMMQWRRVMRWLPLACGAVLGGLMGVNGAFAQGVAPDAADAVAIMIDIPAQATIGGETVPFSLSVQNTHPRQVVTFTALIVMESGLVGPESWSAQVTPVADGEQGRIFRWTTSVDPRRTVRLNATSRTGNTPGVQPALSVRLTSDEDQLNSTREIELVRSQARAGGNMTLTDLTGDPCDLEDDCLLLLNVTSPNLQSFSGGPFSVTGCEFLGLDEEFSGTGGRIEQDLFWFVTRTEGEYGRGCTIATPIVMGNRTFTVTYTEERFTYLPLIEADEIVVR